MKWLIPPLLFASSAVHAVPHVIVFALCNKPIRVHFEAFGPEPQSIIFGDVTRNQFMSDPQLQSLIAQLETLQPDGYPLFQDITPGVKEMFPGFECPIES